MPGSLASIVPTIDTAPSRPKTTDAGPHAGATGLLTRMEPVVCRVLCVSPGQGASLWRSSRRDDVVTHRLFNVSIALSAVRCLLSYVFLPVVLPAVGGAARVPAGVGLPIGLLALVFDVLALRRFWASSHRWRWPVTGVYVAVIALVLALLSGDVAQLV